MIVRARQTLLIKAGKGSDHDRHYLTEGNIYPVLAIRRNRLGRVAYFIILDGELSKLLPEPMPARLFEVVDPKQPADWTEVRTSRWPHRSYITFPAWASAFDAFYNALADDDPDSRGILLDRYQSYVSSAAPTR